MGLWFHRTELLVESREAERVLQEGGGLWFVLSETQERGGADLSQTERELVCQSVCVGESV